MLQVHIHASSGHSDPGHPRLPIELATKSIPLFTRREKMDLLKIAPGDERGRDSEVLVEAGDCLVVAAEGPAQ
jgi:hypothetical protein